MTRPDADAISCGPTALRLHIDMLKRELEECQTSLRNIVDSCTHKWRKPEQKSKHHPAYYIPSDEEQGLQMGVDRRPGCHVPSKTDTWWERECELCGKIEKTTTTKPTAVEPVFGDLQTHW